MRLIIFPLMLTAPGPAMAQTTPIPQATEHGGTADDREVLAAIDAFFVAVHDKDRAKMLETVLPEGLATAIRVGEGSQPVMRSWHWATYIENQIANPPKFTERLMAPRVLVERDIAMVWAGYELLVDGAFDHCGVDHFDMVRRNGKWLIYNLTWTNQKAGCPGR
jgi:hypothetical protein